MYQIIGQDRKIYSEKIKIINYNIEYYKELCYNQVNKDELTYLLGILDMDSDELDNIVRERRDLKVLADMIKDINDEKRLFEFMDPLEEKKKWERTFEELGEKKGISKTAKNMIQMGLNNEIISKATRLSIKQIMML